MIVATNAQIAALILTIVVIVALATFRLLRPVDRYGYKHLYNALRETAFDSVFLLDGDGRIRAVNEVAVDVFGQTRDAMLDQSLSSFFVREDDGQYAGVVDPGAVLERDFYRNPRTIHAMAIGPGQQEFHAEVRVRPVFGSLRPRFMVVVRDIAPKFTIGQSPNTSDQKYRRLFNQERPHDTGSLQARNRTAERLQT